MSLEGQHFDVVIIGAGMSGLAAGIRLALFEKNVLILERHNAPGGLNSFYSIAGRKYDVGLHALTNFTPPTEKASPLNKIFRQLRIPREAFDLSPQSYSRIRLGSHELRFSNDQMLLREHIASVFPHQIDAFDAFNKRIRSFDDSRFPTEFSSAKAILADSFSDPELIDMLCLPVFYYGSAMENNMDWTSFVTIYKALFFEGFARPFEGVRTIIRALLDKYRSLGGKRKMKCGVAKIIPGQGGGHELILDSGESITADKILSSIGLEETYRLLPEAAPSPSVLATPAKRLSFVETITVLKEEPKSLDWDSTITFFCTTPTFSYKQPSALVDTTSGVICIPNNYAFTEDRTLPEGILRITALANYDRWKALSSADYKEKKAYYYKELTATALALLPGAPLTHQGIEALTLATDMFTPTTVEKFTGHLGGAVYGAAKKLWDGVTPVKDLYISGTDQGYLGITGSLISGITMANLRLL